ncbi:MAG: hypothetical protein F6K48_26575 [Okeania sp. SIO3H1]|uniref:hypothetical protein n=1 Tax=Okeania sp. SIO1I7 TaxID=2607772 RepID=UPI0013C58582|nr:hypothetical protein [Okeania sp. SIO1I7]NEN92273.1 hypothetical protein [Okeania sp. SIO3H1]NET24353.1 hypothetical protein [Okeania sp. SIO1I7]
MKYIPFVLMNLSQKLYGILKSLQRKLGLETAEIDDSSESLIREYGIFILLFGILFLFVAYQSWASNKDK